MNSSHYKPTIWEEFYEELYGYRFEFFFFTALGILFGSLLVTHEVFRSTFMPILFRINLLAGILLISKKRKLLVLMFVLFGFSLVVLGLEIFGTLKVVPELEYPRLALNFLFYALTTREIILQVWHAQTVNNHVIFGLMNGFISLGLIGFFILLLIEIAQPGSFNGLQLDPKHMDPTFDSLIYFSYITLLTVGYGDIYPLTPTAQRATIFIGMMGQFYLVILTAVVVEKYIRFNYQKQQSD